MTKSKAEYDAMRAEMKRAVRYRSGPDMLNTIYLGGMATSGMMTRLGFGGRRYYTMSLQDAIDQASDVGIQEAWDYQGFQWILGHYRKAGSKLFKFTTVREEID